MSKKNIKYLIVSSDYTENISIPIDLAEDCQVLACANFSETVSISLTVNGLVFPVPPKTKLIEFFERENFNEIDIETADLGHNFVIEAIRGYFLNPLRGDYV